jgi:hypothetical protein
MPETQADAPAGITVRGRKTPMVLSVARRLREGVPRASWPAFGGPTCTVRLCSATDAQRVDLTCDGRAISIAAGGAAEPDVQWQVTWTDPVPSSEAVDQVPESLRQMAKELQVLLAGESVSWPAAARDFWARTSALAGMPAGLHVVCTDPAEGDEVEVVLGDPSPDTAVDLHGTSAALSRIFDGRSLFLDELTSGELAVNGGLPDLSSLFGATLRMVCGEV